MSKVAFLDAHKSPPEVEIIIGHTHFGKYQLWLWDADERNPTKVGGGNNTDNKPEKFQIAKTVNELNAKTLSWEIIVSSFAGGTGQSYSATVVISQDDIPVSGGIFPYSGPLEGGAKMLYEHVKFSVK